MKKILRNIALIAVAVVGVVSCTESGVDDAITPSYEGITIRAIAPGNDPSTKIEFTDNGAEGIALNWEVGDTFDLCYGSDTDVCATFECTDAESGAFISTDVVLLSEEYSYDAYYKSVNHHVYTSLSEQNGDEINNLDAACKMKASFSYDPDEDIVITFAHTKAIMTFKFESAERPAKLIFENGDDTYTVTYSELEPVGTLYTSHIMIEPCEATERTLTFSLYAEGADEPYDVREVTTSIACVAGYRYTSPVSDLDPTVWLGSGTESDPYQITTAQQLRDLSTSVSLGTDYSGKYFVMTNDIDLDGIDDEGIITEENEFTAIGDYTNQFKGNFDGGGYEVSGLYIYQTEISYQALFGCASGGTIKNLGVSGSVTGYYNSAGVVGYNISSTITNCYNSASIEGTNYNTGGVVGTNGYGASMIECYNTGTVTGTRYVGGVVGCNNCFSNSTSSILVTNCYNSGVVNGTWYVGGIAGKNNNDSSYTKYYITATNCYNTGYVNGTMYVGGIVGENYRSLVINCYNTASVKGDSYTGGIAGRSANGGSAFFAWIVNCYSTGSISISSNNTTVGGIVGENGVYCEVTNCYYNSDNYSGNAMQNNYGTVTNAVGYSTTIMQSGFLTAMLNNGASSYNDSNPTVKAYGWASLSGGYPALDSEVTPIYDADFGCTDFGSGDEEDPYIIMHETQLRDLATTVNGGEGYNGSYFELHYDIDLGGIDDEGTITEENEFTAIGSDEASYFQGTFDGGGHCVSGLYINQPSSDYQGLFGHIRYATVKNLGVSGSVTGKEYVGGVVGRNHYDSTVSCCYNAASVKGESKVGGVAGENSSTDTTLTNCYNTGSVEGDSYVGGVTGMNMPTNPSKFTTTLSNCYNRGSVTETGSSATSIGGVVGYNASVITNCYSTGSITTIAANESYVGGVAGNIAQYTTISDCIYDSSVYEGAAAYGICSEYVSTDTVSGSDTLTETMIGGSFAATLGDEWKEDSSSINGGYPVLSWQ